MQREWSVVNFVEEHSICYVPSSWLRSETITRLDGEQREVVYCYWPADAKNDEQIRSWIRNCSHPDRETWTLIRCKCKGRFHSTDAAMKALKDLEGTDSTTDTDAMPKGNLSTGEQSTTDEPSDRLTKSSNTFDVDHTVTTHLLHIGTECECNLYVCILDDSPLSLSFIMATLLLRLRERLQSIMMSMFVSVSVCLSVCLRGRLWNHTCNLCQVFLCMLPMSVAQSSSGMLTIGCIACRQEGGDGSAQRVRSVVYDCLVISVIKVTSQMVIRIATDI